MSLIKVSKEQVLKKLGSKKKPASVADVVPTLKTKKLSKATYFQSLSEKPK